MSVTPEITVQIINRECYVIDITDECSAPPAPSSGVETGPDLRNEGDLSATTRTNLTFGLGHPKSFRYL